MEEFDSGSGWAVYLYLSPPYHVRLWMDATEQERAESEEFGLGRDYTKDHAQRLALALLKASAVAEDWLERGEKPG